MFSNCGNAITLRNSGSFSFLGICVNQEFNPIVQICRGVGAIGSVCVYEGLQAVIIIGPRSNLSLHMSIQDMQNMQNI